MEIETFESPHIIGQLEKYFWEKHSTDNSLANAGSSLCDRSILLDRQHLQELKPYFTLHYPTPI